LLHSAATNPYFEGRFSTDPARREFHCPLCKALGNALVPFAAPPQPCHGGGGMSGASDTEVDPTELADWVRAARVVAHDAVGGAAPEPPGAEGRAMSASTQRLLDFLHDASVGTFKDDRDIAVTYIRFLFVCCVFEGVKRSSKEARNFFEREWARRTHLARPPAFGCWPKSSWIGWWVPLQRSVGGKLR
jgi:hypothetical protein